MRQLATETPNSFLRVYKMHVVMRPSQIMKFSFVNMFHFAWHTVTIKKGHFLAYFCSFSQKLPISVKFSLHSFEDCMKLVSRTYISLSYSYYFARKVSVTSVFLKMTTWSRLRRYWHTNARRYDNLHVSLHLVSRPNSLSL